MMEPLLPDSCREPPWGSEDLAPDADLSCDPQTAVVYNWKDITSEFTDACKQLELGELLHDSRYTSTHLTAT